MNILFLSLIDFDSLDERNIYTDLLRKFVREGHNVNIISPVERKNNRSSQLYKHKDYQILKVKIGNIQKCNMVEKAVSTILLEGQFIKQIKKYLSQIKYDLVLYSTPPITFGRIVGHIKHRDGAKAYLLLKDIFPQNAVDLGIIKKSGLIYNFFKLKEKTLYTQSDWIGCMSPQNVNFIRRNNSYLNADKVEVCPNSIEPRNIENNKFSLKERFQLSQNAVIFMYGGNLGKPQGVDFIIKLLNMNKNLPDRFFIICGTGTEYVKLAQFMNCEEPSNIRLINGLSKKDYDEMLQACDVGMIFLDHRFTIPNFPSRILSYMEKAMPILAFTDKNTDVGPIIEGNEFGLWCESRDCIQCKEKIDRICAHSIDIETYGFNARNYLDMNYTVINSYEIIMRHFDRENENV